MRLTRYLFDMKTKDLDNMISQILEEQTKILIKEEQDMEGEGKKLIFDTVKGFQSLSNLVNKISNIEDISNDQHEFGIALDIKGMTESEMMSACGGESMEEAQKNLMQGLHLDLEEKGLGNNFDIDIDVSGEGEIMDLKINIVSNDTEKLGTDMSENTQEPMEGNAFVAALNKAKEAGEETFTVDGETHNVEESWKQLEEEEGDMSLSEDDDEEVCEECSGSMNEEYEFDDFDTKIQPEELPDYSAFEDAQAYYDSITSKGDGEMEMAEGGNQESCDECGSGLMSEGECMECGYKKMEEGEIAEGGHEEACEECGSGLMSEGECMECGYQKMNESKSYKVTESTLINMISNIVLESIPGLDAVKTAHSEDKGTKEYMNSVDKKLKDYLSFDGNDNPEFPKQIGKGEKVAINNTEEENEFVEDNRGGGMQHLEYDEKPSADFIERLKKSLSGDSTMGNKQDGDEVANVVKSDLGEKMSKQIERKHKKDEKAPMYVKDPELIKTVKDKTVNESLDINEAERSPVKKVMNSIFRKNGIKKVETQTTSVRGFTRTSGSGYNYEYNGLVTFHKISADTVKDLADQMKEAGVKVGSVRSGSIEFDHTGLKETVNESAEKTKTEILNEMKRMKDMLSYNKKTQ
jgi:hypothetical protein